MFVACSFDCGSYYEDDADGYTAGIAPAIFSAVSHRLWGLQLMDFNQMNFVGVMFCNDKWSFLVVIFELMFPAHRVCSHRCRMLSEIRSLVRAMFAYFHTISQYHVQIIKGHAYTTHHDFI